jgi:polysaccharide biosynthesis/export protein
MKRLGKILLGAALLAAPSAAVADTYKLRPGDVLEITVWQDQKLNRQAIIAPDGILAVPLAGRLKVGGLTAAAAEELIKDRLQPKYVEPLDVTVSYVQSPKKEATTEREKKDPEWTVYVTGEVAKPGAFVVPKRPPTVLQAIALAGGVGPFGANKRIQIHRKANGQEYVYEFNYTLYEKGENLEGNITLRNGDVIVVPERRLFE